ncbi:general secretion pathway protein [Methylobacterium sp. Leaf123]|uniref:PulJ/GspJ family protein n=1 Tax=Methylobacterium sp. Leaf123 TaxID=1736264 RepID=UPI000700AB18|nr:prepilin-type N-terminal cleavage/methylation domain-containing protein [Methylobacterium sp. Leaf123]KQQ25371.1 general secretion pathway protein [Methylobacterium sp. Leaf123]
MIPHCPDHDGAEDGFTIVEMLVAFTIVALCTVTALQISASLTQQGAGVEAALRTSDEAQGIVWLRFALGSLRPGQESGRFSDGSPWVLTVADVAPALDWRDVPPVWHLRLTRDDPRGPIVYETVLAAGLGG